MAEAAPSLGSTLVKLSKLLSAYERSESRAGPRSYHTVHDGRRAAGALARSEEVVVRAMADNGTDTLSLKTKYLAYLLTQQNLCQKCNELGE